MDNIILTSQHIHLTGYKGVAMASIAQIFADLGKTLSGSDVAEDFVTQPVLEKLSINSAIGFAADHIPSETELLVYTAAHQGPNNVEVIAAKEKGIPVLSQAEALGMLFNEKKGIAVCGVGGKSTTSAMISWIFTQLNQPISYSVGVGSIAGLPKTGQWAKDSEYFVAEADEYVIDPGAPGKNEEITPRFSYLKPQITICTFLAFDHPDVYKDFEHTKAVFKQFFLQLKQNGVLIINGDQAELKKLAAEVQTERKDITVKTFGLSGGVNLQLTTVESDGQLSIAQLQKGEQTHTLKITIGGNHNVLNATAALLATESAGLDLNATMKSLLHFRSTSRRFEYIGQKKDVLYYDDYAHHPREVKTMIETVQSMYPSTEVYVAFQPHTFSRTKALFQEFVEALATAKHLLLLPIFASAREKDDPTVSSDILIEEIKKQYPHQDVSLLKNIEGLSKLFTQLKPGSVVITLGAGDIYQVHDKIGE